MTGELIAQDGDSVDLAASLEMTLDLFRRRTVIDLYHPHPHTRYTKRDESAAPRLQLFEMTDGSRGTGKEAYVSDVDTPSIDILLVLLHRGSSLSSLSSLSTSSRNWRRRAGTSCNCRRGVFLFRSGLQLSKLTQTNQ
jgi:hypothetical protein